MTLLSRWNHPKLGMIDPPQIIETLKTNNLLSPLLDKQYSQAKTLLSNHKKKPHLYIFINVTVESLLQKDFVALIKKRFSKAEAKNIVLELLESSIVTDDFINVVKVFKQCRAYGINVALDDYGAGSSSLNRLLELKVDFVKLDRSFVQHLGLNTDLGERSKILAQSVRSSCNTLNIHMVAEGVETSITASSLEGIGIHLHQGFLYAKPILPAEIDDMVDRIEI